MAQLPAYTPIFRGKFPAKARSRWTVIRRFINFWCMPDGSPLVESFENNGLIEAARSCCAGEPSYSLQCWLALVEQSATLHAPQIRDCPAFEPIENHVDDPAVKDATVIMISGEGDLFWAVANSRLAEDDPPVEVFQKYDPSSSAFEGRDQSLSEFALKYLCLYNEFAVRNREWFSADGTAEDVRVAQDWFEYSLVFDSDKAWCGRLQIFEINDAVAIVRDNRLEVSVFCDPATLDMPTFLRREMNRHVESRREFEASKKNVRRDGPKM